MNCLPKPFDEPAFRRAAYNLAKAQEILGNVKVQGWQAHVLLNYVHDHLQTATENVLAASPQTLGSTLRTHLARLSTDPQTASKAL
ncbi:MAG: hypothetical protein NUW01_06625 [Gemmatimonadaceae bacterium]|nr:hypothetical protein [Gemmatimonadaceae bacterium]